MGILGSMIGLLSIFMALPSTVIAKKFGAFKILVLTLFFSCVGYLGSSFSPHFVFFIPFFLIAGLGFGLFHPIAFSLVARFVERKKIGTAMGNYTAIGDIGRIILSTALTFLITLIGWRPTSLTYGLFGLVIFFFLFSFHLRNIKTPLKNPVKKFLTSKQILKNFKFILVICMIILDNFASSSLFIFLPFLLLAKGVSASSIGLFTAAYFLGNFLGKSGLGRIADIFKNSVVFMIAEFFMALSIFFLAGSQSAILLFIFSLVLGTLTQGTSPVRTSMAMEANSHHDQVEEVFAITSFFAESIIALTPTVLGRIADLYGVANSFNFAALIALFAIIPAFIFTLTKSPIALPAGRQAINNNH